MTHCALPDRKPVKLKPVVFLRNWTNASAESLKRLARVGFPVIVDAQELQNCSSSHEFFDSFAQGQLQIVSQEVEETQGALGQVVSNAIKDEWTHIIALSQFHEELISEIEALPEQLVQDPFQFIFYTSPRKPEDKNNPFVQRLLDLGDFDYRHLKTRSAVYPVFHIQNLKLSQKDGLEDVRILVSCLRKRHSYRSVPVPGVFSDSPTHNWWVQKVLDTWLLTLSSLHRDQRPIHSATSFAAGAFLACTPFYGLQTALIILFSMVFRLSFPVAFLGSQISLPPFYSLIVPLQIFVGFKLTGTPFSFDGPLFEVARQHFTSWLIGSLLVGGCIAFVMGLMWYFIQRKSQVQRANWTGKMRGGRVGNFLMVSLLKIFGLRFSYFLLFYIVPYFYLFAPTARRGLSEYYQILRPNSSWLRRQWMIMAHLYKFAQILVDQAYQANQKEISFDIQYLTGNVLRDHQQEGTRLMLFSHFGGWGISTQGFSRRDSQKPIHMIRYQTDSLSSESVIREKNLSNLKAIAIKPGEPVFMAIHEVLREGGHLAIMGDRPFDNNFELKNLLGRLAPVPSTPFRLAKTYSAKLSFVVGFRIKYKAYGLATETLDLSVLSPEQAQKKYLTFLESYLHKYPDQWFNLFKFWSSLPTLPNGQVCRPVKNHVERAFYSFRATSEPDKGL